jgi:hypothetical protein
MISMFLLILALVLAVLATIAIPSPPRFHFLSAAIACLILYFLTAAFHLP